MRSGAAFLLVFAAVACSRSREDSVTLGSDSGFVAGDAGQIPLTTPGSAPLVRQPTVHVPMPPMEEIPASAVEEPVEGEHGGPPEHPDTVLSPRRSAPVSRQQRAADTLRYDSTKAGSVPLVVPPAQPDRS